MTSSPWRHREQTMDERAAELEAAEREFMRAARRLLAETLLGCVACSAGGLMLIALGLHTSDAGWGGIAFWSGLLVGDVGMIVLLLRHSRRSERYGL